MVLVHSNNSLTEWGILGDVVHDTLPQPKLRLHSLGLEEISGDQPWLSLGNAVLEWPRFVKMDFPLAFGNRC